MNSIFKYIGYVAVSVFVGWISSRYPEIDYIGKIETSIVPILLSLIVLYTTLSSMLIKEVLKYSQNNADTDISPTIKALKRNVVVELSILGLLYVTLSCKGFFIDIFADYANLVDVFTNSLISFSILYFILVIYDSFSGLFDILIANSK